MTRIVAKTARKAIRNTAPVPPRIPSDIVAKAFGAKIVRSSREAEIKKRDRGD